MRTNDSIQERIDGLRSYSDYEHGPDGRDQRYKHQGQIDALLWVLNGDE